MIRYDRNVILQFADSLYGQARRILFLYPAIGVLLGLTTYLLNTPKPMMALAAFFLGVIGYQLAQQRAFALRLQAQVALCQVQIEENTSGHTSRDVRMTA